MLYKNITLSYNNAEVAFGKGGGKETSNNMKCMIYEYESKGSNKGAYYVYILRLDSKH
jgi:hypothetical protein